MSGPLIIIHPFSDEKYNDLKYYIEFVTAGQQRPVRRTGPVAEELQPDGPGCGVAGPGHGVRDVDHGPGSGPDRT